MVRLAMVLLSAAPAGAQSLPCLGLTATREGGRLVVAEVAPEGLAAQAGVLPHDVLEALVESAPDAVHAPAALSTPRWAPPSAAPAQELQLQVTRGQAHVALPLTHALPEQALPPTARAVDAPLERACLLQLAAVDPVLRLAGLSSAGDGGAVSATPEDRAPRPPADAVSAVLEGARVSATPRGEVVLVSHLKATPQALVAEPTVRYRCDGARALEVRLGEESRALSAAKGEERFTVPLASMDALADACSRGRSRLERELPLRLRCAGGREVRGMARLSAALDCSATRPAPMVELKTPEQEARVERMLVMIPARFAAIKDMLRKGPSPCSRDWVVVQPEIEAAAEQPNGDLQLTMGGGRLKLRLRCEGDFR